MRTSPETLLPCGYQQLTGMSASTALTIPDHARFALVQAEAQAVRWRDDGTDPTASVGMTIPAGETLTYAGNLASIRLIQTTSGAIANVTYYG